MFERGWVVVSGVTTVEGPRPLSIDGSDDLEKVVTPWGSGFPENNGRGNDIVLINGHAPVADLQLAMARLDPTVPRICIIERAELSLDAFAEIYMFNVAAFLTLPCSIDDFETALTRARAGETYISEILSAKLLRGAGYAGEGSDWPKLSAREREVLALMLKGLNTKLIARRLDVSVRTVEAHRLSIRKKTGGSSYAQLALLL